MSLPLDEDAASERFNRMLRDRWVDYMAVNMERSAEAGDRFWRQLCSNWLADVGLSESCLPELQAAVWENLYGPRQTFFSLFEDVLPALDRLKDAGVHLAVISNWDYSLHRILKMLDIGHRFDLVIASLEEGFEKPDPRIFEIALNRFGLAAHEALHVGDDPGDDHAGAKGVGMRSLLIDRERKDPDPPFIANLVEITETPAWTN